MIIYSNLKQTTSGVEVHSKEEYLNVVNQPAVIETISKVRALVREGKIDKANEVKRSLPVILPWTNKPNGVTRSKVECKKYLNDRFFIDLDGLNTDPNLPKVWAGLCEWLRLDSTVEYADVSPKGGVHIIGRKLDQDAWQSALGYVHVLTGKFGIDFFKYLDQSVKDESRCMFCVSEPNIITIKNSWFEPYVFNIDDWVVPCDEGILTQPVMPDPESLPSAEEWQCREIVRSIWAALPDLKSGNRHENLIKAALWTRYYARFQGVDVSEYKFFDHSWHLFKDHCKEQDVKKTIHDVYQYELNPYLPNEMRTALKMNPTDDLVCADEMEYYLKRLDQIDLPTGLREVVNSVPRHKCLAALMASFAAFATAGTGVHFRDPYSGKWTRLTTIVCLIAPQGAGKQQIFELADCIVTPIAQADKEYYRKINEYNDQFIANGGKSKTKEPKMPNRIHGSKFSSVEITRSLANSHSIVARPDGSMEERPDHLFIKNSDAGNIITDARRQFSDLGQWMLKSFEEEDYQTSYRNQDNVKGPQPALLNWLLAMTRDNFFDFCYNMDLQKGVVDRIIPATFPYVFTRETQPLTYETRKILQNTASYLMSLNLYLDVSKAIEPVFNRGKDLEEKAAEQNDTILANSYHRRYGKIPARVITLSSVLRQREEIENGLELVENHDIMRPDYEPIQQITVTQDDINLGMLIADYCQAQWMKFFYPAIRRESLKSNKVERGFTTTYTGVYSNSRDVTLERLSQLPSTFTNADWKRTDMHSQTQFGDWARHQYAKGLLSKTSDGWQKVV